MRKWFLFLIIIVLIYIFLKATRKREPSSPFHQRFNETLSVIVWALVIAYVLSFLYWLYTQIFK
jgi:multisubunit Na+/H+ antiporter MnhB subunit